MDLARPQGPEATAARRWLGVAVGALVLAGLLSACLLVGRVPPFDRLVTDPLFFRRCLVVHVDLAMVVWFYAFIAALLFALAAPRTSSKVSRLSPFLGGAGVVAMLLAAARPGARPVLANYVPMIDTWLFAVGLVAFGIAVVASFLDVRLLPGSRVGTFVELPDAAIPGLRATGIALLVAALTFAASWLGRPSGLTPDTLFELANWGGGHVLQLASTCALLSVWIVLVAGAIGRAPFSRRLSSALFGLLVLPWLSAPLLAAAGIQSVAARSAFTTLMQLGLFPIVIVVLALCVRAIVRARASLRDPRLLGFLVSGAMAITGFVLGALVRGSTTMVPAHYHASIGAVTAAFMTLAYPLLDALGVHVTRLRRASRVQPLVYGAGQLVFAVGFAIAGAHGMARKAYGAEQHGRDAAQTLGLVVMGAGGLAAVTGGVLFLVIVVSAWRLRDVRAPRIHWRAPWSKSLASTHSKG